jgi:beta-lactamase regulating signal transducer with metallopeptidase domain/HEAT repeat protein
MPTIVSVVVLVVKATIILLAAAGVTRVMQRASAGARHLVWLVTLGVLLVVPALAVWGPLPVPVFSRPAVARHTVGVAAPLPSPTPVATTAHPAVPVGPVVEPRLTLDQRQVFELVWGGIVLLILASFAWSGLVVRRIVRRARVLDGQGWVGPLVEVADRMGLEETPRLLVSADTKMPFACGVFTPTIVLPEGCEGWSLERRQAVLLHELAHVRRRDLLGHMLGRVVCAAYWFHPLVWMAATRLRSESERACDDLALACGTRATDYAEHLLDIVTSVRGDSTPVVALAMARRREFEGRMLAILDPDLRRVTPTRRQSFALVGSLGLIACLVAAATPVARVAHVETLVAQQPVSQPPVPVQVQQPTVRVQAKVPPAATPRVPLQAPPRGADTTADNRPSLLAKVLRGDSSAALRKIAAWGLAEYDESEVGAEALVNAVAHDRDASVREMAAWALGSMANDRNGNVDALSAAARSDADPRVRRTAIWALGSIASERAIPALTEALKDQDPELRSKAAWAIGSISPDRAPAGLTALLSDPNAETRKVGAWALYQIHDPATVPAIEAALKKETDPENQIDLIRALAEVGDSSVSVLSGLLESADPRIKSMAVRALAGRQASGPWPMPMPEPRPNP